MIFNGRKLGHFLSLSIFSCVSYKTCLKNSELLSKFGWGTKKLFNVGYKRDDDLYALAFSFKERLSQDNHIMVLVFDSYYKMYISTNS